MLRTVLRTLNTIPVVIAGVAVLALMSLASINVCLRIARMPYSGTYEIVAFLGAIVTAFALGDTQFRKSHIVVDIVSDRYPAWLKKVMDAVGYSFSAVFFFTIGIVMFNWGNQIAASGEVSETLKIIYYPFVYIVAIGFFILSVTLFVDLVEILRKK
jgi:TRAP-type C4-dicarboxylate transport system permease small subunit